MIVFVYGTLLKEMGRASVLSRSRFVGPALIDADLFDLGYFPGVKEGKGTVIGEVYDVDKITLRKLDGIEGYDERYPEDSLYLRKVVSARMFADGNYIDASCYFYNREVQPDGFIACGDYRRFLLERNSEDQWVLAYGSNLSSARLMERVERVNSWKTGFVEGYELALNKKASGNWEGRDHAYANIRYVGGDSRCPAVAYRLSPEQIQELDRCEGVPDHYLRISIPFQTESGRGGGGIVQAYIAHPEQLTSIGRFKPDYMQYITDGYEEHGLGELVIG